MTRVRLCTPITRVIFVMATRGSTKRQKTRGKLHYKSNKRHNFCYMIIIIIYYLLSCSDEN